MRVQVYGVDPNAVAEFSGGVDTRFTFGVGYDAPLAMQRAGVASFFSQDALSSVTSLTGSTGAVTGRYSYDTYGQIKTASGTASPYTYTGREWDGDAGIYDYRARQYDPATGRFLSEDPVPASNSYVYAAGIPTSLGDPSGESPLAELTATGWVIQGLAGAFYSSAIAATKCDSTTESRAMAALGGFAGGAAGAIVFKLGVAVMGPGVQTLRASEKVDWLARGLLSLIGALSGAVGVWVADRVATGDEDPIAQGRAMAAGALLGAEEYLSALQEEMRGLIAPGLIAAAVEVGRGLLDPGANCR